MDDYRIEAAAPPSNFGRRKITPTACICDRNAVRESIEADEQSADLDVRLSDPVVIGSSGGGVLTLAGEILTAPAVRRHAGKVLMAGQGGGGIGIVARPCHVTLWVAGDPEELPHLRCRLPNHRHSRE